MRYVALPEAMPRLPWDPDELHYTDGDGKRHVIPSTWAMVDAEGEFRAFRRGREVGSFNGLRVWAWHRVA